MGSIFLQLMIGFGIMFGLGVFVGNCVGRTSKIKSNKKAKRNED